MEADILPLASRIPVSMANLFLSDSVNPFKNSSSCERKTKKKSDDTMGLSKCTTTHFV